MRKLSAFMAVTCALAVLFGYSGLGLAEDPPSTPPGIVIAETDGSTAVAEGGDPDTCMVALEGTIPPTVDVRMVISGGDQLTVDGGASAEFIFTPADYQAARTVTIAAVDDTVAQGPRTATLSVTTTSDDALYGGLAASVGVAVTDNDRRILVNVGDGLLVGESGETDTFTVALNLQPTAEVRVTLTPDSQLLITSPTSAELIFGTATWNVPQTVTVAAVNDTVIQGSRTVSIGITTTSEDAAYIGLSSSVSVTVTDNDGLLINVGDGLLVAEGGETDTFAVALNLQPSAEVRVALTPDSQLLISSPTPAELVFGIDTWNVPQTVTVAAVDDTVIQGSRTAAIGITTTSADAAYAGLSASVSVTVTDNDGLILVNVGDGLVVAEGGETDAFTVALNLQPTAEVKVTLTPDSQLLITDPVPAELIFGIDTWNVPQAVTIAAVEDEVVEGPHSGTITLVATGDNYAGQTIEVTASITEGEGNKLLPPRNLKAWTEEGPMPGVYLEWKPPAQVPSEYPVFYEVWVAARSCGPYFKVLEVTDLVGQPSCVITQTECDDAVDKDGNPVVFELTGGKKFSFRVKSYAEVAGSERLVSQWSNVAHAVAGPLPVPGMKGGKGGRGRDGQDPGFTGQGGSGKGHSKPHDPGSRPQYKRHRW